MKKRSILLNEKDNVATALTDLKAGEKVYPELNGVSYEIELREDIQFAHKFALRDIAQGEEVLKYGMPIGKALQDIKAGEWVHVHNCRSHRFGFHREKYGLNA
ncbi:MAG: UxaA family hydrolase [Chloroflexi bacterium]|nr:UxaA family hydrolase [Chloroflexota bacterium]